MLLKDLQFYHIEDFPAHLPQLRGLYEELLGPGKALRGYLVWGLSQWLGLNDRIGQLLAQSAEFIHHASLLHDDVVDRSSLRRHKTAAWVKYGVDQAVLAGDYLLARVMVNLSQFGHIRVVHEAAKCIRDLVEGEWLQDAYRRNLQVTWSQSRVMARLKTGSLFQWCFRAAGLMREIVEGPLPPGVWPVLSFLGEALGWLFQASDDLLDWNVRNYENKATFQDLPRGLINGFLAWFLDLHPHWRRPHLWDIPDLSQWYEHLSSEGLEQWEKALIAFDQEHQRLLERSFEFVDQLAAILNLPDEFNQALKQIFHWAYWRQGQWPLSWIRSF